MTREACERACTSNVDPLMLSNGVCLASLWYGYYGGIRSDELGRCVLSSREFSVRLPHEIADSTEPTYPYFSTAGCDSRSPINSPAPPALYYPQDNKLTCGQSIDTVWTDASYKKAVSRMTFRSSSQAHTQLTLEPLSHTAPFTQ